MQWSRTDDAIFYVSSDSENLTAHTVTYTVTDGVLTPLAPETIFSIEDSDRFRSAFEIDVDGKRFLLVGAVETAAANIRREPTIVVNWTKELAALVPAEQSK